MFADIKHLSYISRPDFDVNRLVKLHFIFLIISNQLEEKLRNRFFCTEYAARREDRRSERGSEPKRRDERR